MAESISEQLITTAVAQAQGAERIELIDAEEPGLRLRITIHSATWSLLVRVTGPVRVRLPLGDWPALGISSARASARAVRAQLAGGDPEGDGPLSVSALLQQYGRKRLPQLRRGASIKRSLESVLSGLRHREVSTVTRRDIVMAVDLVAERAPIHANRMLAYVKAFFGWAVGRGYVDSNPAAGIPKVARETSRDRTPGMTEMVEIWNAAEEIGYPFGHAIRMLILTAARRDEVGVMRLSEFDLPAGEGEGCWTLPADRSKNGRAIRVPLSAAARTVLEGALEARKTGGPYVFTTRGTTPASGWSKAKARVDSVIAENRRRRGALGDMAPWRVHDLRRAFATAACDVLHIDPAVADRCLNHVGSSTTSTISRVYGRNEMFDQRREALTRWAQLLEEELARRGSQSDPKCPVAGNEATGVGAVEHAAAGEGEKR